jgi:hypothetical protein
MPIKTIIGADGQSRYVRAKFQPRDYTVPPDVIPKLKANFRQWASRDLLAEYDGPFMGMTRVGEIEHAGRYFMRLIVSGPTWAIDVELTDSKLGEILPVPPEETWKIARSYDAERQPPIDVEDE